jgi:predicted Zn-dependent protease
MSLTNRVLRELSGREKRPGDVMAGVQVSRTPPARGAGGWRRVGALLVLIGAFTALLWAAFGRKPAAPPAEAPGLVVVTPPPLAATTTRFRLDDSLASVPPAPASRTRRAAPSTAPRAESTAVPAEAAPGPAPAPAPRIASARDQREADARHTEAARALRQNEPRTAEQGFRDALALNPQHHAAREALATLLLDQMRLAEGQALLEEGLALEPQRSAFRRLAARLDLLRGQPALAVQRLEPARPPVNADPEYHGLLASAYQRLERHEEAARLYQQLTQAQPGEAHWWAGYGLSRDALGDAAGALAAYAQARGLGRLDPRVLEHINRRTATLQAAG